MTEPKKRRIVKRHVKHASTTNKDQQSLVQAVITRDVGAWVRPAIGATFFVDETPRSPTIAFEIKTDAPPPLSRIGTFEPFHDRRNRATG